MLGINKPNFIIVSAKYNKLPIEYKRQIAPTCYSGGAIVMICRFLGICQLFGIASDQSMSAAFSCTSINDN